MTDSAREKIVSLTRKLSSLVDVPRSEIAALESLPLRLGRHRSGHMIVSEGQKITECCLLLSGYACGYKLNRDGGRQIVSFHLAGDLLDIQHLLFDRTDHHVQLITDAELAFFPMAQLRFIVSANPAVAKALWRDCLIEMSILREWVLNVGRRDAKSRIAHILCEFLARREAAGLGSPYTLALPMTQEQIADATGLTSVHVNRMMRELREDAIVAGSGRDFRVVDWPRLKDVADFQSDYLHTAA